MKLSEYLTTTGFTKASLARALGINRAAVSQWDDIPEKWLPSLEGLQPTDEPMSKKAKNWDEYTVEEMRDIFKRRGGLEGDSQRVLETDHEIACSLGFSVWEFNLMVDRYILMKRRDRYKKEGFTCLQDEIDSDGIPRNYRILQGEKNNEPWREEGEVKSILSSKVSP